MLDREAALKIASLSAALSVQERALADAFIADPLISMADLGEKAGYHCKGPTRARSRTFVGVKARAVLKRPRVQAYIAAIMEAGEKLTDSAIVKFVEPLVATADEVKQRLTRIARTSLTDVMKFGENGEWTGEFTFTRDGTYCLREIQVERITRGDAVFVRIKPKIDDRLRALQALATIHGLVRQPDDARRDEVVAKAWARVFAKHPEIAKEYHFALLESGSIDVTPVAVPVNGSGRHA